MANGSTRHRSSKHPAQDAQPSRKRPHHEEDDEDDQRETQRRQRRDPDPRGDEFNFDDEEDEEDEEDEDAESEEPTYPASSPPRPSPRERAQHPRAPDPSQGPRPSQPRHEKTATTFTQTSRHGATRSSSQQQPQNRDHPSASTGRSQSTQNRDGRSDSASRSQSKSKKKKVPASGGITHSAQPKDNPVLIKACRNYEQRVVTQDAFPDNLIRQSWADESWKEACKTFKVDPGSPDETTMKEIRIRGPRVRGAALTEIRGVVEKMYAFRESTLSSVQKHNATVAQELLDTKAFFFKDPERKTGIGQTEIIKNAIQAAWFATKVGFGPSNRPLFRPMPLVTIALAAALVHCCLDEWSTGFSHLQGRNKQTPASANMPRSFTERTYKPIYLSYLDALQSWVDLDPATTTGVLKGYYDELNTKCQPVGQVNETPKPILTAAARNWLAEELQELRDQGVCNSSDVEEDLTPPPSQSQGGHRVGDNQQEEEDE